MINHTPHLRPYQEKSIEAIYHAWINHKSVLFQMPTGTGKTTVFAEIVRQEVNKEKKVLIVAHRQEIIYQIQERLSHFGLDSGIIMSNHLEDRSRPIQIASISTIESKRTSICTIGSNR
ncbi:MAG: DEAD/DEAH box helicase [bacterium]